MRKFLLVAGSAVLALMLTASVAQGAQKLKTFSSDSTVSVTVSNGIVTIVLPTSTTIPYPHSGGVFLQSKSNSSKALSNVDFSFASSGDVQGGAPRFSLPIDTDGNPNTNNGYAFLDAAGCGGTVGTNDTNATTVVSTDYPQCRVNFASVDYDNWDAFAAANPTYRMGQGYTPFIIADGTAGTYVLSNIALR